MNGAHGEAESLAQALAAQEQYRSYWIFLRWTEPASACWKRSVGNALPGGTGKSGSCEQLAAREARRALPFYHSIQFPSRFESYSLYSPFLLHQLLRLKIST